MDKWEANGDSPRTASTTITTFHDSHSEPRQKDYGEVKNATSARRATKADREKLRRDRLNEHFQDLGNILDPDGPKNDKATILSDAVQAINDLVSEVDELKTQHASLSEESYELTQEKNELRQEKASLRSEVDNLKAQCQQGLGAWFPCNAISTSAVMATPFPFPVGLSPTPGPIPIHPTLQPIPFFGNQPGSIAHAYSTFMTYQTPGAPCVLQPSSLSKATPDISTEQDSRSRSVDQSKNKNIVKVDDSNDVVTDLELKIPGSAIQKELLLGERNGKRPLKCEKTDADGCCSSKYASS